MAVGTPGNAGSHTRRSLGTRKSSGPVLGGGVPRKTGQAFKPSGSGQGNVKLSTAKASPKSSPKVIGQRGRTVAGNSAMPGSKGGGKTIKSS